MLVSSDDSDDEAMPPSTETNQVCGSPRVSGQIGDNIITKKEYGSLADKTCVSDGVINFMIRELDINDVGLNAKGLKSFLVLSTSFYVRLITWNNENPKESSDLLSWEGLDFLWRGGARYIKRSNLLHK